MFAHGLVLPAIHTQALAVLLCFSRFEVLGDLRNCCQNSAPYSSIKKNEALIVYHVYIIVFSTERASEIVRSLEQFVCSFHIYSFCIFTLKEDCRRGFAAGFLVL